MTDINLVEVIGDELYEHRWVDDECSCGFKPGVDHVDHQAENVIQVLRDLGVIS